MFGCSNPKYIVPLQTGLTARPGDAKWAQHLEFRPLKTSFRRLETNLARTINIDRLPSVASFDHALAPVRCPVTCWELLQRHIAANNVVDALLDAFFLGFSQLSEDMAGREDLVCVQLIGRRNPV